MGLPEMNGGFLEERYVIFSENPNFLIKILYN